MIAEDDISEAGQLVNKGVVAMQNRKLEEALAYFQKAGNLEPDYALAQFNIGCAFDELGEGEHAVTHYERAIRLDANYPDPCYNLAVMYQTEGQIMLALKYWYAYLRLGDVEEWRVRARREIDKLKGRIVLKGCAA